MHDGLAQTRGLGHDETGFFSRRSMTEMMQGALRRPEDFPMMKKTRRQEGLLLCALIDVPLQEIAIAEVHFGVFGKVIRPAPLD